MQHPTFTVTFEQRLAADAAEAAYIREGYASLAETIRMARQAESFPNSYTSAAVELSERIIRTCTQVSHLDSMLEHAAEAQELRETGRWYR